MPAATLPTVLSAPRHCGSTAQARSSAFLHMAGWAAGACPTGLLCRLHVPISRGSPTAGSLALSLCLCLSWSPAVSPSNEAQRRQTPGARPPPALAAAWPPSSTVEAPAAASASRLRGLCVVLPEQGRRRQGRGGREDTGLGVLAKLSTCQQLGNCPQIRS